MITEPEVRDGVNYRDYFKEYSNPGFAAKIWEAYHKELVAADLLEEGISILGDCMKVSTLDVRLSNLLEDHRGRRVCVPKPTTVPAECDVEDGHIIHPTQFVDETESGHGSYPWPRL